MNFVELKPGIAIASLILNFSHQSSFKMEDFLRVLAIGDEVHNEKSMDQQKSVD